MRVMVPAAECQRRHQVRKRGTQIHPHPLQPRRPGKTLIVKIARTLLQARSQPPNLLRAPPSPRSDRAPEAERFARSISLEKAAALPNIGIGNSPTTVEKGTGRRMPLALVTNSGNEAIADVITAHPAASASSTTTPKLSASVGWTRQWLSHSKSAIAA